MHTVRSDARLLCSLVTTPAAIAPAASRLQASLCTCEHNLNPNTCWSSHMGMPSLFDACVVHRMPCTTAAQIPPCLRDLLRSQQLCASLLALDLRQSQEFGLAGTCHCRSERSKAISKTPKTSKDEKRLPFAVSSLSLFFFFFFFLSQMKRSLFFATLSLISFGEAVITCCCFFPYTFANRLPGTCTKTAPFSTFFLKIVSHFPILPLTLYFPLSSLFYPFRFSLYSYNRQSQLLR